MISPLGKPNNEINKSFVDIFNNIIFKLDFLIYYTFIYVKAINLIHLLILLSQLNMLELYVLHLYHNFLIYFSY